jgi:hypothetical protein
VVEVKIRERVFVWLIGRVATEREPDFIIGDRYLLRWWVIPRNPIFNIYLHCIRHSDDDRALHDHPWANLTWVLDGRYLEIMPPDSDCHGRHTAVGVFREPGDLVFRWPTDAHRLEILERIGPAWTLFFTGPRIREWGFHCPKGWRSWRVFTDPDDCGQRGRGCD